VDVAAYRDAAKHDKALERDPLVIAAKHIGDDQALAAIGREAREEVAAALKAAHAAPLPPASEAYAHVQDTGADRGRA
jgi:TPP-dependent pyruvate/acetoin dehydrogenase alpha subunit